MNDTWKPVNWTIYKHPIRGSVLASDWFRRVVESGNHADVQNMADKSFWKKQRLSVWHNADAARGTVWCGQCHMCCVLSWFSTSLLHAACHMLYGMSNSLWRICFHRNVVFCSVFFFVKSLFFSNLSKSLKIQKNWKLMKTTN